MKHSALVLLLVAFALRATGAEPALEFTGILIFPGKTLLALKDHASGTSQWLEPGHVFGGYTVVSYDPKEETIVVSHGRETLRLRLRHAKVKSAQITDLRHVSRDERQMVWDKLKDLEGQELMEALIRNGSLEMLTFVEGFRDRIIQIDASRTKLAKALLRPALSDEKKTELKNADAMLVGHLTEIQPQLTQSALALKGILQRSIIR